MKRHFLILNILLLLIITTSIGCIYQPHDPLASPFDTIIPPCDATAVKMITKHEESATYDSSEPLLQMHDRKCHLDDLRVVMGINVYTNKQELEARNKGRDRIFSYEPIPREEYSWIMRDGLREYEWLINPLLYESKRRFAESPQEKFRPMLIFEAQMGRYVMSVTVVQEDQEIDLVDFEYQVLMWDMANLLVDNVHTLAVSEGHKPGLSELEAIGKVMSHVVQDEMVFEYITLEPKINRPIECEAMNPGMADYFTICSKRPWQQWEDQGRPTYEHEWKETEECAEAKSWLNENPKGIELFFLRPTSYAMFPWRGEFFTESEILEGQKEIEKFNTEFPEYAIDFKNNTDPWVKLFREAIAEPYWRINGGETCNWIIHEGKGVVHAYSN